MSVVRVLLSKKQLGKKTGATLKSKAVRVQKTAVKKKQLLLRNKKSATVRAYKVTKKYKLKRI